MLLTVKQLAEFLQVSEKTVRRKAEAKELPYSKVGSQYRFDYAEVLKHIKKETNKKKKG